MASGSARAIRYILESVFGTTPSTPTMKVLRNTGGDGIQLGRSTLESGEFRSDRAVPGLRLGNNQASLSVPFELSFASFDDFFQAALGGTWTDAYSLSSLTVSVSSSGNTFTRGSGSWLDDGVKVGDRVTFSGFSDSENNGTFLVSAVTDTVITCATASGLVTVSDDTGIAVATNRQILICGSGLPSMTIEEAFTDIDVYQVCRGMMIKGFSLSISPDAIITGSFSLIGKAVDAPAGATVASVITAANTNEVFASHQGYIKENDTEIAIASAISLNFDNGLEAKYPLFTTEARSIGEGRIRVTGEISAMFEDSTLLNKYVNETESSIEFKVEDPAGNDYIFIVPRVKYSSEGKSLSENDVTQRLGYQGLYDETAGTTLQIEKRNVA